MLTIFYKESGNEIVIFIHKEIQEVYPDITRGSYYVVVLHIQFYEYKLIVPIKDFLQLKKNSSTSKYSNFM